MTTHLIDGEFQSDKYPTCPRGKVPLSCKDPTAQDLLWAYAQRRRAVDAEFSDDLEAALKLAGYEPEAERERDDLRTQLASARAELEQVTGWADGLIEGNHLSSALLVERAEKAERERDELRERVKELEAQLALSMRASGPTVLTAEEVAFAKEHFAALRQQLLGRDDADAVACDPLRTQLDEAMALLRDTDANAGADAQWIARLAKLEEEVKR